ncbi:hypothetical protein PVAP13_1KG217400 [Panicum virgatum]|uniref:Uncharacterized protein n=1 Tax=Panicum virgatum TaxID=38727 RepID=A0A8T0XHD4_PANVG|nr:hypothetical protein PVAP13_1KG217400 [Panicum virgatum]
MWINLNTSPIYYTFGDAFLCRVTKNYFRTPKFSFNPVINHACVRRSDPVLHSSFLPLSGPSLLPSPLPFLSSPRSRDVDGRRLRLRLRPRPRPRLHFLLPYPPAARVPLTGLLTLTRPRLPDSYSSPPSPALLAQTLAAGHAPCWRPNPPRRGGAHGHGVIPNPRIHRSRGRGSASCRASSPWPHPLRGRPTPQPSFPRTLVPSSTHLAPPGSRDECWRRVERSPQGRLGSRSMVPSLLLRALWVLVVDFGFLFRSVGRKHPNLHCSD